MCYLSPSTVWPGCIQVHCTFFLITIYWNWKKNRFLPIKTVITFETYIYKLLLFLRRLAAVRFYASTDFFTSAVLKILYTKHTHTPTQMDISVKDHTKALSRIPSDLADLRLTKLFVLFPLQTRYLVPVETPTVVFVVLISRHRQTSKSSPIWVVRLYLLMLLWDTKLNSTVLFDFA